MELKDWVKAARKHKGLTLAALGEAMHRSKATAGFWESGATKPSYAQMKEISDLTGYPMPEVDAQPAATSIEAARRQRWPFDRIDYDKLVGLRGADARNLENALLAAAADIDLDIRTTRSGKRRAA